jgi:hypothetical protein
LAAGKSAAAMEEIEVANGGDVDEGVAHSAAAAMRADITAGPVLGRRRRHDLRFGRKVRRCQLIRRARRVRACDDNKRRRRQQKPFHFPNRQFTKSRSLRTHRHCERSEAIQNVSKKSGLLRRSRSSQ